MTADTPVRVVWKFYKFVTYLEFVSASKIKEENWEIQRNKWEYSNTFTLIIIFCYLIDKLQIAE